MEQERDWEIPVEGQEAIAEALLNSEPGTHLTIHSPVLKNPETMEGHSETRRCWCHPRQVINVGME